MRIWSCTLAKLTLLNDNVIQSQLHLSSLNNTLLHCVFCDKSKHMYLLLLTNTMGTVLWWKQDQSRQLHHQCPHVVTVLWQGSDNVATVLSSTSGTSEKLQNCVSLLPWLIHSGFMLMTAISDHIVAYYVPSSQISTWAATVVYIQCCLCVM